ncbi:MAG TPA: hypothetical protein VN757_10465 [Steroidobacteraceae bacterium]|nr:hypothetical protein [Steroidobacteraceae bacterium]
MGTAGKSNGAARHAIAMTLATLLGLQPMMPLVAGPNEQAVRMHNRLAGVPPSAAVTAQMATLISGGNPQGAAQLAMNNSGFYNVTLRNFISPATNRAQSAFVPLNDYTATVIGMIRDNVPFNTVLSADLLYIGNVSGAPPYSPSNNNHYLYLDDNGVDLKTALVATTQSSLTGIPSAATAGVITTEAASAAFFIAGTNRAMFRFTMINHLCNDLPQVMDITRPPDRIRQDVSRSPGGDSRVFLNNCIGCHSAMDPMVQAFAYYNYDPVALQLVYTPGQTQAKYHINTGNFPDGFVTPDDSWQNRWRSGPNALLGWSSALAGSGNGAKSLGQELENSQAFANCQVQKVFQAVCLRPPSNAADRSAAAQIVADFQSGGYNMKQVFAETAVYCMGN